MAIENQVAGIIKSLLRSTRGALGEFRNEEYSNYVKDLIKIKEIASSEDQMKDLVNLVLKPMVSDRMRLRIDGAVSSASKGGGQGGVEWQFINLSGEFSKQQQQAVQAGIELETYVVGHPDYAKIEARDIEELRRLLETTTDNIGDVERNVNDGQ